MSSEILRMERTHIEDVARLEQLCFSEPWSAHALELLCTDRAVGYVCVEDGAVMAYGGMLYAPDEGQITNIATSPDARRRGFAAQVLGALLADASAHDAQTVSLEVRASNAAAIALYTASGFYTAGVRRGFYRDPREDALVMLKTMEK